MVYAREMFLLAALANASPLVVHTESVTLSPIETWTTVAKKGSLTASRGRVGWAPGTVASLCSTPVPVDTGHTLLLKGKFRGDADLGDVTAVHLHAGAGGKDLHVARRRIDPGDHGWEDLEIRATAPAGTDEAWVCVEAMMQDTTHLGGLRFEPFSLQEITAESRSARLPLPRIILVSIEAFRRDHVSAYGYPRATTPILDALIAGGASLDQHFAQAPYTHPSLATLVTGQLPTTLGFSDNTPSPILANAFRTAAERFADAGYVTASFNVQYVLSNRYGLNRGFHYYRNHPNDVAATTLEAELYPWLDEHGADNSFVWVHLFEPHGPYRPPASIRARFEGDAVWNADTMRLQNSPAATEGVPLIPNYVYDRDDFERRHYVAGYDGDIYTADAAIGRLVKFVKDHGWEKDTLIVVTADHGESMTDHDRYFSHGSLYNHDLHVPMVFWAPGRVTPGRKVTAHTGHIDVLPTLMDYAGLPADASILGQSMKGLLDGETARRTSPFTVGMVGRSDRRRYALMGGGGTKVVVDRVGRLLEVYELLTDPLELHNLVGAGAQKAQEMASLFASQMLPNIEKSVDPKTQALDPEDIERLRALGYLE